ncbi:hypothetical protein [Corynebacterium sp. TAE3-ERU16]|uniref:hypothetical protein n=1 Tax=Corynebacterium sp. TAE3-ERU16 TaxID=2849493 RepID=UPI001C47A51B|nr:hypothetical protein [Corynebacterium sp. TAE3-ERU16]MBV7293677.1 hypothetical protein [Corynebacterium sp. TAE3-ERU16]
MEILYFLDVSGIVIAAGSAEVTVEKEAGFPGSSSCGWIIPIPIPVPGVKLSTGPQDPAASPAPTAPDSTELQTGVFPDTPDDPETGRPAKGLPVTGANVLVALGTGAALALAGFDLVFAARRRRDG